MADLLSFAPSVIEEERNKGVTILPVLHRIIRKCLEHGERITLLSRQQSIPYYFGRDRNFKSLQDLCLRGLSQDQKERVVFSTTHGYKGLQADTIVLLDVLERRYPLIHRNHVFTRIFGDTVEKLVDDERRLFYVACTRAIKRLILITESEHESPFLTSIKSQCQLINWFDYPAVSSGPSRWVVKIGNLPGQSSQAIYQIRDNLKASGFQYKGSYEWKHWWKTIAKSGDEVTEVIEYLSQQAWHHEAMDVQIVIEDQDERSFGRFVVNRGKSERIEGS